MDCRPRTRANTTARPVSGTKPAGTFCQSLKEDPEVCRSTQVPEDHIDLLVGMPTVHRPEVGFTYLRETIAEFLKLPANGRLVFHPRVFEFKHGASDGEAFTPDAVMLGGAIDAADPRLVVEHVRTKNVSQEWSEENAPRGMWHPLKASERQHNEDLLAMMRRLEGQCAELRRGAALPGGRERPEECADTTMVMLTEDDFLPCGHFFPAMNELLFSKCVRRKDVLGLRVSTGGSGVIVPCRDLNSVANMFERAIDHSQADYLLSFVVNFQPDFDRRALARTEGRRPFLVYYQSVLKHIGAKRARGGDYVFKAETVPECGQSLTSMGVIEAEFWTGQCRGPDSGEAWELVQPCGALGTAADPSFYQRSDDGEHAWYFKYNADDHMWRCLANSNRGFYKMAPPRFAQHYLDLVH